MASGTHKLEYRDDGVYLTIHESNQPSDKIFKDVMARLSRKELKGVTAEGVNSALKKRGAEFIIAPAQPEKLLDGSLNIIVSRDAMKAECSVEPPDGGQPLYIERAKQLLNNVGITAGIDEKALEDAINSGQYGVDFVAAKGKPAINGTDARIEYHFEMSSAIAPKVLEDGRVDYKDLGFVRVVNKGDALATYYPPSEGERGFNLRGAEIAPKRGRDKQLAIGANVSMVGNQAVADIDGRPELASGRVTVLNVLDIAEDVGNATGNIDFPGSVIVRGSVNSNFSIKATGSVTVGGTVEAALIEAGGDIVLSKGIQGAGRGTLVSGGDIIAKFVENANLRAQGDVRAVTIMHSNVESGNKVVVTGKKGIMGGYTNSAVSITAHNVGSTSFVPTTLEVGLPPQIRARQVEIAKELKQISTDFPKLQASAGLYLKMKQRGPLPPDKLKALEGIAAQIQFFNQRLNELNVERQQQEEMMTKAENGSLHVKETCYQNVKIVMGRYSRSIESVFSFTTFKLRQGEIEAFPYEGTDL